MIMAKTVGLTVHAWGAFRAGLGVRAFHSKCTDSGDVFGEFVSRNHVKISTQRSLEQCMWSAASPFAKTQASLVGIHAVHIMRDIPHSPF